MIHENAENQLSSSHLNKMGTMMLAILVLRPYVLQTLILSGHDHYQCTLTHKSEKQDL
ncbi:hypothetical protein F2Q69_00038388 [Brassica cretica]|uniref:Uncharacterized protein n=1 Tax=Brassica cretica TaxID=69181 RepID=A0A8S9SM22_BRACR|nr:hypothetical protein F2Q69_00038388 [Brassica cretica]